MSTGAWVCDACAGRLGLSPGGGPSYPEHGWCGAGQHRTGKRQKIVWHSHVPSAPISAAVPQQPTTSPAPSATGQLQLF